MIDNFEDFCLYMYVLVDDLWRAMAHQFQRLGSEPTTCSDSELLTMALIGECRGWALETDSLSYWGERRDLFPRLPSQSRFNRRRRTLSQAFNLSRCGVLQQLDIAQDRQCLLDSFPVSVINFQHVPRTGR